MARITVGLKNDHLARLVRGPSTGLAELIWNALDADAKYLPPVLADGEASENEDADPRTDSLDEEAS